MKLELYCYLEKDLYIEYRVKKCGEHLEFIGTRTIEIDAPKKMVTKNFEKWVNVYENENESCYYNFKHEADNYAGKARLACIHVKQDYEVEE